MRCAACDMTFSKHSKFIHHCVGVHGVSRISLERKLLQHPKGEVVLVLRRRGGCYLMVQAPLL